MTDVDSMPAGRDLDEMIALGVFGWEREGWHPSHPERGTMLVPGFTDPMRNWCAQWDEHGRPDWLPKYSDDIALAWDVVMRLRDRGWTIWVGPSADNGPGWDVQAKKKTNFHERTTAETVPLAICRAAVKAVRS